MIIEVTQDDINNGQPRECASCPVALALKRYTNKKLLVHRVCISTVEDVTDKKGYLFELPSFVTEFIDEFDHGYGRVIIKPFSFEVPDNILN